jgi:hypothetical protein
MLVPSKVCGCEDDCYDIQSCEKTILRTFDVSVPVTVVPYATPEKPEVKCSGEAGVVCGHKSCDDYDNIFEFTVTQKLTVDIPIRIGAEICYGKTCAEGRCKGAGAGAHDQPHEQPCVQQ